MPFVPFASYFLELAKRETRVLTLLPGSPVPLPPGEYSFIEMFCDEEACDCRRAFFAVHSMPANKTEAIISWGWESAEFYKNWLSFADAATIKHMQGPVLDLSSPNTRNAVVLLETFAEVILADPAYVERVKRHYVQFRKAIDSGQKPVHPWESQTRPTAKGSATNSRTRGRLATLTARRTDTKARVGRNSPCPCGSGKKFKNCCLS